MIKENLDTPVAIIDLDKMDRNIAEMADVMREAGIKLRPHTKTHKIPAIAHRQLRAGAVGITVAKTGEAEVMAAAGIEDIFIAYPIIGASKWERLAMLNRQIRLRVSVDSIVGAQGLSDIFARRGERIEVLMKIDTGLGRTGVLPGAPALRFAQALSGMKGIHLAGIYTHEGHVYKMAPDQRRERVEEVGAMMRETVERLRSEGFEVEEVSVGSTPAARIACTLEGVTEVRSGNYIFYDGTQVALDVIPPSRCALTVLCTVVSTPTSERAILDGGTKAFSSARNPRLEGMGIVVGMEDAVFSWANEEHGVLDLSRCPGALRIGDRVEVIPVHVCETVNLWDELVGVRGDEVEVVWPVAGRGKMR